MLNISQQTRANHLARISRSPRFNHNTRHQASRTRLARGSIIRIHKQLAPNNNSTSRRSPTQPRTTSQIQPHNLTRHLSRRISPIKRPLAKIRRHIHTRLRHRIKLITHNHPGPNTHIPHRRSHHTDRTTSYTLRRRHFPKLRHAPNRRRTMNHRPHHQGTNNLNRKRHP